MQLFGFTLLRNGAKYDYCYKESLRSLGAVCEKVYLAFDRGEDNTEETLKDLEFLKIIPSTWDMSKREGGLMLSIQTNVALDALRKDYGDKNDTWGFYLQCDEVLHEEDYELIKADVQKAQEQGFDTVAFRYLHFWDNHHSLAINKKWYPQEIRCVKLNSNIESWGDAQSFRNYKKVYYSDARIFHYGHVREADKYVQKKHDIMELYHTEDKIKKYRKRERRFDKMTKTLLFFGNHPALMKDRIIRLGDLWSLPTRDIVYIVDPQDEISESFSQKVNAKEVVKVNSLSKVPCKYRRNNTVIIKPSWWQKIFYPSTVPEKMESKLALAWPLEFVVILKLSEKNIGLKSC
ncbi:MAG: hypothetical protein ACOCUH_00460 [Bacteriovoracia bacterium]